MFQYLEATRLTSTSLWNIYFIWDPWSFDDGDVWGSEDLSQSNKLVGGSFGSSEPMFLVLNEISS